jgi:cellulose synthase/poly-beta-1,6-N-acetylglucosamine synthase-like glycosyltransferase
VISVLIYSEHDPEFLEHCLNSLTPPPVTRSDLEILVLDSGMSRERSVIGERLVTGLGQPFRWLPSEGETRRTALYNLAVHASKGDILVFTHDDAYFPKQWLHLLTAPFQDPLVGCASGEDEVTSNTRPFLMSLDYVLRNPFGSGGMRRGRGIRFGYFTPRDWNMAFPKHVLLEVGLFNPTVDECSEAELVLRIRKAGYKIAYVPEARVFHTRETSLRQITRTNFQRGRARSLLARKEGFMGQFQHFLASLLTLALPCLVVGAIWHKSHQFWILTPLFIYIAALLFMGIHAFTIWRRPSVLIWTPLLVLSQHLGHGLGYLFGLFATSRKREERSE